LGPNPSPGTMIVTVSQLPSVAADILKRLFAGDVLALSGPLASGKTTLTQAILKEMGYDGRVTSPTFVLEKHYPVNYNGIKEVVHLDFYRLKPVELTTFGWKEYLGDNTALTIIEWPEIGLEHLPHNIKTIKLEIIDDQTRNFLFSKNLGI
ncbi:MAG: tRNA (adenosine(37)-N6)-threonylcarbamoyltransferase complex ATPase subunit type 1 TsaE, partial [Candidatus Berkelbacteria bacterium]|nr:tRNA (adenosine(37)-N6)-threonylcarbamoyltransferase complex ATPase subunit type 1 TsaE [Candidatus Berkelbacteria bacterium]